MSDLIAFLNARLDEDEAYLNSNRHHLWTQRPLREAEAKRQIVTRYEFACGQADSPAHSPEERVAWEKIAGALDLDVRSLAAVYSDHPDCWQEWVLS